jgi:hypothetical protein
LTGLHTKFTANLRALHVGMTKVRGNYLTEALKEMKSLKKLGLKGLGTCDNSNKGGTLNKQQMQQICLVAPQITHLDISGCMNIDDSAIDNFQCLKFINLTNAKNITESKKNYLRSNNITVIDTSMDE